MEIVSLFGSVKNYDKGLLKISNLVNNTMAELGLPVKDLNLGPPTSIPFYDGIKSQVAAEFINSIKNASGVILLTTAGISGASSVLNIFLEHLEVEPDILKQKNCMLIVVSSTGDASVLNSLSKTIVDLGGYDSVRILLDNNFFTSQKNKELVEKQVEDYYRIVRQKRKFYTPVLPLGDSLGNSSGATYSNSGIQTMPNVQPQAFVPPVYIPEQKPQEQIIVNQDQQAIHGQLLSSFGQVAQGQVANNYNGKWEQPQFQTAPVQSTNHSNSNYNQGTQQGSSFVGTNHHNNTNISSVIDNFNKRQNDDIQEITSFFSKKYSGTTNNTPQNIGSFSEASINNVEPVARKTPRQLTASLVHHYQPQLAGDLICTIQLNISGNASFNGYIVINNTDCNYYDGQADNPTLTVLSDENSWVNVITGKVSAQKAFMTGSLKIKGNFVVLTRFDQIFNTSKNYI